MLSLSGGRQVFAKAPGQNPSEGCMRTAAKIWGCCNYKPSVSGQCSHATRKKWVPARACPCTLSSNRRKYKNLATLKPWDQSKVHFYWTKMWEMVYRFNSSHSSLSRGRGQKAKRIDGQHHDNGILEVCLHVQSIGPPVKVMIWCVNW